MKLSLCITTYNRYHMTIESFMKIIDDPRINDIVIYDDASDKIYQKLFSNIEQVNPKIRFFKQSRNVGMYANKKAAIEKAKNEWCIIFDSDNIIDTDYLDAFFKYVGDIIDEKKLLDVEKTIFCPDFAQPKFDYRKYASGIENNPVYSKYSIGPYIIQDDFNCLMNTCNYIVNRDFYLKTYQHNPDHKGSDTIWHNYNHLKADGKFAVVPGMQYFHRVHKDSGFLKDAEYNITKANEVRKLIQQL